MLTSGMLVVSDTSPLSNLAIIGRLELVREQLGMVAIPPAVRAELSLNPKSQARAALEQALREGWIRVMALARPVPADLLVALDLGEAEALGLALEAQAGLVLLDESAARMRAATHLASASRVRLASCAGPGKSTESPL